MTPQQLEDLAVLNVPSSWPQWPIMPMKKANSNGQMPTCGSILACEGYLTTIVVDEGEILWGNKCRGKKFGEIVTMFPTIKFDSYEAMLEAGWECD